MVMLIKFGDYNNNYKYIFFAAFFNYFSLVVNNGNLNQFLSSFGIIQGKTDDLYIHPFISDIFNYIGIIIISFILYKIKEKKSGINKQNNKNIIENNVSEIKLIHNNVKEKINENISLLNLIFILSYWIIIDHITRIIESLMIFDYWMFELFCICLIVSYVFKIKIYSHQKLGIIINSLTCLIIVIIKYIIINNHFNENKEENIYYFSIKNKWFVPLSIIIYFFIIISTSYIYVKLKFYMDLKFISSTKLLILYGIIGFVFSTIACIIETIFKCVGSERDFFCKIKIYEDESDDANYDSYIENINIFFEDFSSYGLKDIIIEIIIFFFGMIFYYGSLYFEMLVINSLTPMHFMFSSLIYLFVIELGDLIRIIKKKNSDINNEDEAINKESIEYLYSINLFNISAYICSLIGFMIYLEIIELNFCKLNYNLRKYINERSIKDTYDDDANESIIDDGDNYERNPTIINNFELPFNEEE